MSQFCEAKINECIASLEKEVMQVLNNPKTDKSQKNILLKPLSSKKKILQNAIESMQLVDNQNKKG